MLNKLKEKMFGKDNKQLLQETLKQITLKRKEHQTLVLCGTPTDGNWLGIAIATKNIYPENTIDIPQWYSNSVFNPKETRLICQKIKELKFEKIIFSGFASYFFEWINLLNEYTYIEIIFHGTISEFNEKTKQEFIGNVIKYSKQNKIKNIGFIKKGLSEVFKKLYGINSFHQILPVPKITHNIKKIELEKNKIHIGVFGIDNFNKNIHNQVIYSLTIKNTIIHVLDKSNFAYLNLDDRIIAHGKNLPREVFLNILGSMDFNLHMSYNESFGLIAHESEALGVPCIILEDVDYIKKIHCIIYNKK